MSRASSQKPGILRIIGRFLLILIETVLLIVIAAYGVMFVLAKGPSKSARNIFIMSVRETSAIGFLADWFCTPQEIAEIESSGENIYIAPTDTSLITISTQTGEESSPSSSSAPVADAWGLVDEDNDGIILERISRNGYSGYMMIVKDPKRVIMGSVPNSFGTRGYTVAEMVEHYGAVAGINAGGFYDPNGQGNGSEPDSLVVFDGQLYYGQYGTGAGFVGLDYDGFLHVGLTTSTQITEANIRYGVCFGPVLVSNGQMNDESVLSSGVNPRTAIGQRSDGAILLLVIDGRQIISIGATYQDLAELMMSYGAVNACNLDGGSSTLMWYEGDYINNCASVVGIRPVPTTFLVMPAEG